MTHIEAIQHYEDALKAAFPRGASGEAFEHWNKARIAIQEAEKQEQPLQPISIGVDVTTEGTSVVGFYRRPDDVVEMFYSQFHPHQNAAVAEPHKQEPVAWIEHHKGGDNLVWDEPNKGTPLYTHPQPKVDQKRPQNCGTGFCSCIECVMEPEPVAWAESYENGEIDWSADHSFSNDPAWLDNPLPLYTHPQPKEEKEPVAWLHWLHGPVRLFLNKDEAMMELDRLNREYPVDKDARQMRPLYTHPQPKREWVGLTDNEWFEIFNNIELGEWGIRKAINDKLKEKNT